MAAFYARLLTGKNVIRIANAHNTFQDKKWMTEIAYSGTKIIAVGEQVKRNLVEYFKLKESQVSVIHNTVKPFEGTIQLVQEFEEARKEGCVLIGNIGRLSEQKGMEYFIKAISKIYLKYPTMRFYIIGDGEDAKKLKTEASKTFPDGILTLLGYRSDIQNVMSQLDFIVLSSLWEGFPLTPIEAFSVGKTIVATNVDGTPEIVKDEVNGLLVESKNVDELSNSIIRMCRDVNLRNKLEHKALETYNSEFSFEILTDQYIQFYINLVESEEMRHSFGAKHPADN